MAGIGDFLSGFSGSFDGFMQERRQRQLMDMQRQKFQRELQDQGREQLLKTQSGRTMERMAGAPSEFNKSGGLPSGLQPQGGLPLPQPMAPGQPSQPMQQPGQMPQQPPAQPPQQPAQMQQAGLNPMIAKLLAGFNQRGQGGQPQGVGQGGTPASMMQGGGMMPPQRPMGSSMPQGASAPRFSMPQGGRNIGPSEPGGVPTFARGPGMGGPSHHPVDIIPQYESGGGGRGRNVMNYIGVKEQAGDFSQSGGKRHTAGGFWQITDTNWRAYAPRVGIDVNRYPSAMSTGSDENGRNMQRAVAQKMYAEQGFAPWLPYNPKLRAAVQSGDFHVAAAKNPQGPEAQAVGATPEGKQMIEQGSRGMLDWRTATRAYLAANPDAKPDEVFDGVNGMMKLMSQDSTAQWRQIQEEQRAGREQETQRYHAQLEDARKERLRQGQERLDERVQEHEDRVQYLKDQLAATADKNSQKLLQDQIKREEGLQKRAEAERDRAISQMESGGFTSLPKKTQADIQKRAAGEGRVALAARAGSSSPGGTGSRGGSPAAPVKEEPQGEVPPDPKSQTAPGGKKPVSPEMQKAVDDAVSSGAKTVEEMIQYLEEKGFDASWLRAKQGGIPGATTGLGL